MVQTFEARTKAFVPRIIVQFSEGNVEDLRRKNVLRELYDQVYTSEDNPAVGDADNRPVGADGGELEEPPAGGDGGELREPPVDDPALPEDPAELLPWNRIGEFGQYTFMSLHKRANRSLRNRDISYDALADLRTRVSRNAGRDGAPDFPDLATFFVLRFPDRPSREELQPLVEELKNHRGVERAYLDEMPVESPSAFIDSRGNRIRWNVSGLSALQNHLDAFPIGLGVREAFDQGWNGSGVRFADIEQGWLLSHPDLQVSDRRVPDWGESATDAKSVAHGTAMLALVNAADNDRGVIGVAPAATPYVISQWALGEDYDTEAAIMAAIVASSGSDPLLRAGDVLLIEAQTRLTEGGPFVPVEVYHHIWTAIRYATADGIIVVEAAGNGNVNLDTVRNDRNDDIFNPDGANLDSGAIIVGAAVDDPPGQNWTQWSDPIRPNPGDQPGDGQGYWSNYGRRVNCFATGEVFTIDVQQASNMSGAPFFSADYAFFDAGASSAATAIIAGAAILVQHAVLAAGHPPLPPSEVRRLLMQTADIDGVRAGIHTADHANVPLGVMPNLAAILPAVAIAAGGAVVVVEPDIAAKPADDNPIPRLVVPGLPARHGGAAMAAEAVIDRWPIIGRLIAALNGLIGRKPAQA